MPDPIESELFKNALLSIADEMALTIVRTAYSGVLRDNMDFSTAVADGDGRLVAQGLTLPGHLGSIPTALAAVLARFVDDIGPEARASWGAPSMATVLMHHLPRTSAAGAW